MDVKKSLQVDYDYSYTGYDLFYVKRGKLEVTIRNIHAKAQSQTFVANDSIIDIPPYHTYFIRVLKDSALYNYGGKYNLAACLEDLASVQENDPTLLSDNDKAPCFSVSLRCICDRHNLPDGLK